MCSIQQTAFLKSSSSLIERLMNNYWHKEWKVQISKSMDAFELCVPAAVYLLFFPPPSTSQPQRSTCVTADAGKLDSVHWVENYNTWPVGSETRLAHAPIFSSVSAPPLIWSTCGVVRMLTTSETRRNMFLLLSSSEKSKAPPQKVMRLAGAALRSNSQKITFFLASFPSRLFLS